MIAKWCLVIASLAPVATFAKTQPFAEGKTNLLLGKSKIASCHSDKTENGIRIQYWLEIYSEQLKEGNPVHGAVETLVQITNSRNQVDRDTEPTLKAKITRRGDKVEVDTMVSQDEKLVIPLKSNHTLVSNKHNDQLRCSILDSSLKVAKK